MNYASEYMRLKRIWAKESKKRKTNQLRKERVNRNWPIHAQRAVEVFQAFSQEAQKDGVRIIVTEPEWSPPIDQIGEFVTGATSVHLQFAMTYTGEGLFTRKNDESGNFRLDIERGSALVIHHSPSDGLIQVFFEYPITDLDTTRREPLLFTHTYDSDDINKDWLTSLISPFLAFNRVESRMEHP